MVFEDDEQEGQRAIPRPMAPGAVEPQRSIARPVAPMEEPKSRFFDPVPGTLLPRESKKFLTKNPDLTSTDSEYLRMRNEQAVDTSIQADKMRDIYTRSRRDIEGGVGVGLGDVINMPDPSDPSYSMIAAQKDRTIANPLLDTGDPNRALRSVVNFLFSDEMGLLGMKWDQNGFDFAWKNFQDQIVEHPISTAFTVGSYLLPLGAAWMKGSRLAAHTESLMAKASDPALRQLAQTAAASDPAALALVSGAGDVGAAKTTGFLGSNLGARFDEHARLVKSLAGSAHVTDGRELINPERAAKILAATTPDEVRKLMPEDELRKILMNDWHVARRIETNAMARDGRLDALPGISGMARRAHYAFMRGFSNSYMDQVQNMSSTQIDNIDKFWKNERFSDMLASLPSGLGKENSDNIIKYRFGKMNRDELVKKIGDNNVVAVDALIEREKLRFQRGIDSGYYDPAGTEVAMFGKGQGGLELDYHLPAVKPETPGFGDFDLKSIGVASTRQGQLVRETTLDPVSILSGPTTKQRTVLTTAEKTLAALPELETDVRKLAVGGYIMDSTLQHIHEGFRDMIAGSLRGLPNTQHWIKSRADYDAMGRAAKANFMSFEELDKVRPGLFSRVDRMVRKDLSNSGQLNLLQGGMPVIDRALVQQMFGKAPGSAVWSASMAGIFGEMLTSVHKTMAVTVNPATQIVNPIGNMVFGAMRGHDPFSREFLNDSGNYVDAFIGLIKQHSKSPDIRLGDLMTEANWAQHLGKSRYVTGTAGEKIDMAKIFADPRIRDGVLEAQGFESVEGFTQYKRLLRHMNEMKTEGFTPAAIRAMATAIGGVGELPGIKQTLNAASAAYVGSDMVPKMSLVAKLARQGWGRDAILMEVGRTFPQYGTVGTAVQSARKMPLPWITFTAETARIMKNNIADHPVAMMSWLQAPQIARSLASATGVGVDYSQMDRLIENAPPWAVRFSSVYLNEQNAPATIGGAAGAMTGGMIGTAMGGFPGAVAGAALGGIGGAAVGAMSPRSADIQSEKERAAAMGQDQVDLSEFVRAWDLGFLPYSSLVPGSLHPHEWEKLNPFSDVPSPGMESLKAAVEVSPVEPFAIAKPLLDLASGRDSMGQEIVAKSGVQFANKMALGLLAFLAPPMISKYGMSLSTPGGFMPMSYIHDANGGQMSLPDHVVPTYNGLLGSSVSFLPASGSDAQKTMTGLGGAILGAGAAYAGSRRLGASPALAAGGAAIAGTLTGMGGAEINTRRLMVDLGIIKDQRTGEYNDPTLDFFVSNWLGGGKSWKVSPKQGLFNQKLRDARFEPYRGALTKEWRDAVGRGSESEALAASSAIYTSFALQTGSTTDGHRKFADWLDLELKKMNRTPMFRDISDEWIDRQIRLMKEMGPEKAKINQQELIVLLGELKMHRYGKARGKDGDGLKISGSE